MASDITAMVLGLAANPGLGALAFGATAGLAAGALVGSVMARPASRLRAPEVMPAPPVFVAPFGSPAPFVQEPLGVASIQILVGAMQKHGGIQFFAIDVFPSNGGAPWRVLRRYNQFHALSQKLNEHRHIFTPFPRKHLTGCNGGIISQEAFDRVQWGKIEAPSAWSRILAFFLIQASPSVPAWTLHLKNFFDVPVHRVSIEAPSTSRSGTASRVVANCTSLTQSQAPVAPPLPPPTQEQFQSTQNSAQGAENLEGMMLEITVPSGVSPGQVLSVSVPSNEHVLLEIPPGAVAGQVLQVWYDPVQGSLQPFV
eukprot:CAMPEP_0169412776 /NCGR_PEP_ID=MMETSP1017-20121227/61001_1 /TAXON_ID=342587 /ORGANISM="Karlodinium micrum, Strain CCMP2283" /LENGTH=311 /DNA_ID=CAMNT_0009520143 /DNA_START=125 /DNA_END=1060 /DNA_ORIENTATION=-